MAHPMKKDSSAGQNAKLKRMTEDYGSAAGPSENILSESARGKGEGPEDAVGFGADASAPSARRGDRSKRTSAANPVSTYRKGGAVKKRADGGDVSAIEAANKNQAQATMERARGGRTKTKAKGTNVNVIIAPQGGAAAGPPPSPVLPVPPPAAPMMPPKPPMPPMGAGPMAGGPMGGPPMGAPGAPGAPGGMPPGIMPPRAKGGRVGMTAGAASGEGRLEKIALQEKAGSKKPQTV